MPGIEHLASRHGPAVFGHQYSAVVRTTWNGPQAGLRSSCGVR
jgi:hypothetical protein